MTEQQKLELIRNELTALRNSCREALDGTWDHTTAEGQEAFEPMADSCETIAKLLGIDLPEYEPSEGDDDE